VLLAALCEYTEDARTYGYQILEDGVVIFLHITGDY
jgi:hypothetical protein